MAIIRLISGVASDQWLPDAELEKWSAPKLETYAEPVQEKSSISALRTVIAQQPDGE